MIVAVLVADGQTGKYEREDKEHVRLDKADEEFEAHEKRQSDGGCITGQGGDHDQEAMEYSAARAMTSVTNVLVSNVNQTK